MRSRARNRFFDKVATSSYFSLVPILKTVGIKELKNSLSAYLREVRRGTRILVADRNRVVAELHEPGAAYLVDDSMHPRLAEWIGAGIVRLPTSKNRTLPKSPVRLPPGTAKRLIDDAAG